MNALLLAMATVSSGILAEPGMPTRPLDIYLNPLQRDAHSPKRDEHRFMEVSDDAPLGQTFLTGPDVDTIYRITIWQAFWHESWNPDERLTLTLWDGPEKKASLGRCSIPYARRMFEGAVTPFIIDARVQPQTRYYFELNVDTDALRPAQIPREWLMAGKRPGWASGDRHLAGIGVAREDYPHGRVHLRGAEEDADLWFEIHARKRVDRNLIYQRAFDWMNLDDPDLTEVSHHVELRQWDAAVTKLVRHFQGRSDLILPGRRQPTYDPEFDTSGADLAALGLVPLPDGSTVDLGPHWDHATLWPQRGGVGLTRSGLRKPLSTGYLNTGNPKYARAFNALLAAQFLGSPSSISAGLYTHEETITAALPPGLYGGSMWSALSIGARMGHGFYWIAPFVDSPYLTEDVRAAFIFNLAEMAELLERMKGDGNWETQMADALFDFGLTYPEFNGARQRVELGLQTLMDNARRTVHADGVLREPTIGYHQLVLNRYSQVIEQSRRLGMTLPDEFQKSTKRMFDYLMYSTLPDGTLPVWGDGNHPMRPDLLERGARLFDRAEMRYVLTGGEQGHPPAKTSVGFSLGGFYYMRSGWSRDAHVLGIRCGRYGSHGHHDALSLVLAACGQTVLIDPGVHTYGTPEARELQSSLAHNTITVDGLNTSHAVCLDWVVSDHFDFFSGRNLGFEGLPEVIHERDIWFLKKWDTHPPAWIVFDRIESKDRHRVEMRYHFAPMEIDADPEVNGLSTCSGQGDLMIRVHGDPRPRLEMQKRIAVWGDLLRAPSAVFLRDCEGPLQWISFLSPLCHPNEGPWRTERIHLPEKNPGMQCLWAERGPHGLQVLRLPTKGGDGHAEAIEFPIKGRALRFRGAGLALRWEKADAVWQPTLAMAQGATLLAIDGEIYHKRSDPSHWEIQLNPSK